MAEIVWDELDERWFEQGVSHGVFYPLVAGVYTGGVAWNGLVNVTNSPSGAEPNKQYADNIPYVTLMSAEEWSGTIECFNFPNEFLPCLGYKKSTNGAQMGGQSRDGFGFVWRVEKGNAEDQSAGYILNLVYGLQSSPSEQTDATKNDSPELKTLSFPVSSTPVPYAAGDPVSIIRVDSTDPDVTPAGLAALEDVLFGTATNPARLPLPAEVDTLLAAA